MGLRVYWELLGKYGLKRNPKWYEQTVESVRKSEDGLVEIWWDRPVAATKQLDHNRPDVVVIDKRENDGVIVDFSVPIDVNVAKVEVEKVNGEDIRGEDEGDCGGCGSIGDGDEEVRDGDGGFGYSRCDWRAADICTCGYCSDYAQSSVF